MSSTPAGADPAAGTFLGHPVGIFVLFGTEMGERFTYYGMRALLLLFLVAAVEQGGFGIDDRTAAAIYGLYTAAVYLVAWPGGWIADRLLGAQRAVLYGGSLIALGNFMLFVPGPPTLFYLGLVIIILGVGLLKPNISSIVGAIYPEGGARRDAGFSLFYMGINVGATIGPLIAGKLALMFGWRIGFLSAAIGMGLAVLQFAFTRRYLGSAGLEPQAHAAPDEAHAATIPAAAASAGAAAPASRAGWLPVIAGVAILGLVVALGLAGVIRFDPVQLAAWGTSVIVGMAVVFFLYMIFAAGLDAVERRRIYAFIVLFIVSALFWSGFEQAGSSFNLFAARYTDRMLGSWELPAAWLQAANPFFIIVFAPVFSWLWVALAKRSLDPTSPVKFAFGLLGMAAGFLVMAGASKILASGTQPLPYWLIATYLLHTFGELALSPVGLSTVTKLAPPRFVGQMMGIWFLSISLGNLIAGRIAGEFDANDIAGFAGQYLRIFWFGTIAAVLLLALAPLLRRWMGGVR
jgi:POT family proton-dependent oligopeptide transporter